MNKIILSESLPFLKNLPNNSIDLIYADPPYNTGKTRKYIKTETIQSENGGAGFGDNKYIRKQIDLNVSYADKFDNFVDFIFPFLDEGYRILKPTGSMYIHMDYREIHYVKIEMDKIFGRENFINEIIWSYDFGSKPKKRWACKHDNILLYVKNKNSYTFNYENVPRIPYLAPKLAGARKAALGKKITDVWWQTIVPTNGKERQNYPTQKPIGILNRIVNVSSNEGDLCLDFFAGAGSFGEACAINNRKCILVDNNKKAFNIMNNRLKKYNFEGIIF